MKKEVKNLKFFQGILECTIIYYNNKFDFDAPEIHGVALRLK